MIKPGLNIWRQALPSRSTSGSRPVAEAHPCLDFPFPQWPFLHGTLYRPDKYMVRNKTERELLLHPSATVMTSPETMDVTHCKALRSSELDFMGQLGGYHESIQVQGI